MLVFILSGRLVSELLLCALAQTLGDAECAVQM